LAPEVKVVKLVLFITDDDIKQHYEFLAGKPFRLDRMFAGEVGTREALLKGKAQYG
jgi:hypothetical protein